MTSRLLLAAGLFFLYAPVALLVLYSFNESRLVTVWGGFSTKWYGELFRNEAIRNATWVSLQVAALSATLAAALGTLAGTALARWRFPGKTFFSVMATAPLVLPEVVTGLSLLLLFVALEQVFGWPRGRGVLTITAAHATLGLAFVAVVVQARLAQFDRSLEEAALDLGAPPWKVYLVITLPLIAPAIAMGWLLAFTLSLDDLVLASFTTGPAATTLPMVIFSSVRLGVSPQVNALATVFVGAVALLVALAFWLGLRRR
jgi:putrescine transport system permease protein